MHDEHALHLGNCRGDTPDMLTGAPENRHDLLGPVWNHDLAAMVNLTGSSSVLEMVGDDLGFLGVDEHSFELLKDLLYVIWGFPPIRVVHEHCP